MERFADSILGISHVPALDGGLYNLAERFDVAVLDVRMPGLDGLSVLRTLREEVSPPEVILLTVVDDRFPYPDIFSFHVPNKDYYKHIRERAYDILKRVIAEAPAEVRIRPMVSRGNPAKVIAEVAEREGLTDVAKRLRAIAVAERHHEERFRKLLEEVEAGTVFKKDREVWWVCMECGYVHYGREPPEGCPSCGHSRSYFMVKCEEY